MTKKGILFIICLLAVSLIATGASGARPKMPEKAVRAAAAATGSAQAGQVGVSSLPSTWSTPETVSNSGAYCSDPYAAIDAKSNVFVSWVEWYGGRGSVGPRRDMMFNTNKSGKWGTPHANPLAYTMIDDVGFPEVTVTKSGNDAIYVWMDGWASEGHMVVAGDEWVNGTWTGVGPVTHNAPDASTYPSLSASPVDDTICFVWQQDMSPGFQLAYRYRDGATGQMSSLSLVAAAQGAQYWPNVFVDAKGTAHLTYITRSGPAQVWYTKNTDIKNANGWTAPLALSGYTGLDWAQPIVRATDAGDSYVVWQEDRSGIEDIFLKYQINGVWQDTINVSNASGSCELPSVAVNPATGEIYVSWTKLTGNGLGNIYLKTYETDKTTGQKAWSSAIQVTTSGLADASSLRATSDPDIHLVYTENGVVYHVSRLAPRLTGIAAPTVTSTVNRVLFASEKTITVSFTKNPVNDDATLKEYRLYAKKAGEADTAYAVIATYAPTDTLQYVWKKLAVSQQYSFIASVVNKDGLELKTTAVVSN